MRILLTGGTGFIGSHLLETLRERHELVAIARDLPTRRADGVDWVRQDLTESLSRRRLPARVDAIVHLAHSRRFRDFPAGGADIAAVNVDGTFRLLEYAVGARADAFVYASTGGVYARKSRPLTELDPAVPLGSLRPLGMYVSTKYAAELLIDSYAPLIQTVVLRLFFVYGVGQRGMLMPRLLERVRAGAPIEIEGRPGLRINPTHVSDAVRAFEAALSLQSPGLFNVAGDDVVSMRGLVRLMERATGRRATVEHTPALHPGDLVGANASMKEVLGVRPAVELEAGVAELQAELDAGG